MEWFADLTISWDIGRILVDCFLEHVWRPMQENEDNKHCETSLCSECLKDYCDNPSKWVGTLNLDVVLERFEELSICEYGQDLRLLPETSNCWSDSENLKQHIYSCAEFREIILKRVQLLTRREYFEDSETEKSSSDEYSIDSISVDSDDTDDISPPSPPRSSSACSNNSSPPSSPII